MSNKNFSFSKIRAYISGIGVIFTFLICFLVYVHSQERNIEDLFPADLPTQSRLVRSGDVVKGDFHAVGHLEPSNEETLELGILIGDDERLPGDIVSRLENFISKYPDTAYGPSIRNQLAAFYKRSGRYQRAMDHWASSWAATADLQTREGKKIADEAVAHLAHQLASLGEIELLERVFAETAGRVLDTDIFTELYLRSWEKYGRMKHKPETSFLCGVVALDKVAHAMNAQHDRGNLMATQGKVGGFSLSELQGLSEDFQLGMKMVFMESPNATLIVPSVIHMSVGHYAAITDVIQDGFRVEDPTNGRYRWLTQEEILEEASGYFIVPEEADTRGYRTVRAGEGGQIFGKGQTLCPPSPGEDPGQPCPDDQCCLPGTSPNRHPSKPKINNSGRGGEDDENCDGCGQDRHHKAYGMVHWRVSEPHLNLWLYDIPLSYAPSKGPKVELGLSFRQRADVEFDTYYTRSHSSFSDRWHSSWHASAGDWNGTEHIVYQPEGRVAFYTFPSGSNTSNASYVDNAVLKKFVSAGYIYKYELHRADGSILVFGFDSGAADGLYMTEMIDPTGEKLTFSYGTTDSVNCPNRLDKITDADGNITTLTYAVSGYPNLVSSVTAPGSRTVNFSYTTYYPSKKLTGITDVEGITSTIAYNSSSGYASSLVTPYGTTTFTYNNVIAQDYDRWVKISEPGGSGQCYQLVDSNASGMSSTFLTSQKPVVSGSLFDVTNRDDHNTFHWNRQQWAQQVSAGRTTPTNFVWSTDFKRARIRHWLVDSDGHLNHSLSHEQAPSPNGSTEGQVIFYDYAGKSSSDTSLIGTQIQPKTVAYKLSNGETYYETYSRNSIGKPTAITTTYTLSNGSVGTRTKNFTYASNGIDMLTESDFNGNVVKEWTWNSKHQPLSYKLHPASGVTYTNTFEYYTSGNGINQLWKIITPAGQTHTYSYGSDKRLTSINYNPAGGSEYFSWLNGNLRTHTDLRGLTRTFTHDKLNRVTQIDYSSGGSDKYYYTTDGTTTGSKWLDLTRYEDRLGKIWKYAYNGIRQKTSETNPLNRTWTYGYCGCGALDSVTDPLSNTTSYTYDYQGNRTGVVHPGSGGSITFAYDALGQMTSRTDGLGTHSYEYNNQGLLTKVKDNSSNVLKTLFYDKDDDITSATDENGVTTTQVYDWIGRITSRTYPTGGGSESYAYSAKGLTSYTNPLSKTWSYAYDAGLRKTSETTPNSETVSYTYNGAGDLLTMTDGRSKVTTWTVDSEGRVTGKKNAGQTFDNIKYYYNNNGLLTQRRFYSTSSSYLSTYYTHDDAGNLTFINYPSGTTDVSFTYDNANRLTQMVDATGTTSYTYTASNQPLTENGPWASDTVTYAYNSSRKRSSLTIDQPTGSWTQTYGYDANHRLTSLNAPKISGTSFTYGYTGHSNLASTTRKHRQLTFPVSSKIIQDYDTNARLTSTKMQTSGSSTVNKHDYVYNNGSQRTKQTFQDASYIDYGYDNLGQLTSANHSNSDPDYTYTYDAGWNLDTRNSENFNVGDRNELTSTHYGTPSYDNNGNITSLGGSSYYYNAENQLTNITVSASWKSDFVYDGRGRKRIQKDYTWTGSAWSTPTETRYIYDGMAVVQERNSSNTPTATYTRGLDLSTTLHGAGGIGGLLAKSTGYSSGNWSTHRYYHSDGSGNVTYLADNTSSATLKAKYKYDAFGRLITSSGTDAASNLYRFSSKELHSNSGLYYYGFRFYDPSLGRWINRDPLGEAGGINLYGFVHNNPNYYADTDGRAAWAITIPGLIGGGVTIGGALAGGAVWITGGAYYWVGGELDEMFGISDGVSDWVTGHNPDGYYPPLALPGSMQPSTPCPTKFDSRARNESGQRNYLNDRAAAESATDPKGRTPCQLLKEWMKAAKAAGKKELVRKLKQAEKAAGCRHHN
jgi:RHS repeat-associated protein